MTSIKPLDSGQKSQNEIVEELIAVVTIELRDLYFDSGKEHHAIFNNLRSIFHGVLNHYFIEHLPEYEV